MRWSLIICLCLASSVFAKPRPKRSIGYIKELISNKLFGTNTFVIARPVFAKNETYQLFKIPGRDDIYIKVTKKDDATKPEKEKPNKPDAVIVKPEVAIIGSYLGTTTEKETLLAIEIARNLIKSGVLYGRREDWMKLSLPKLYLEEHGKPMQVVTEEQGMLVPVPMQQMSLAPQYSYTQKFPEANMKYESYDGKDVIVTRTDKEPVLPHFMKMRIADVATIGANPYLVNPNVPINLYSYVNPGFVVPESIQGFPTYVPPNPILVPQPMPGNPFETQVQQVIRCKEKFSKTCPQVNNNMYLNQNIATNIPKIPSRHNVGNINVATNGNEANQLAVNEFLKNYTANGQLVSQYVYKQMNHHSPTDYTEVKVHGDEINMAGSENMKYVAPIGQSPIKSALGLNRNQNDKTSTSDVNVRQYNTKPQLNVAGFGSSPIVVPEELSTEGRSIAVKKAETSNEGNLEDNNKRGDIPGSTQ